MAASLQKTFRYFYYYLGLFKMRQFPKDASAQAIVDFIYTGCWKLFAPRQVKEEVVELAGVLRPLKPKVIVEIGTGRSGGMLFVYSRVASADALIISIDLPGGEFGDSYPAHKVPIFKRMGFPGQKIYPIRASSHDPATLAQVKKILGGRPVDFLFIDGDHTYEGVKQDLLMYSALVAPEGLIALQDIVPCSHKDCQVEDYWRDIKPTFPHREIVKDWNQRWAGIGVVQKRDLAKI